MRLAQPDNNNPNAKTILEWCKIKNVKLYDPDGFDRTDMNLFENKYTEEEFDYGIIFSTCAIKLK
jgi:hypothetical protein